MLPTTPCRNADMIGNVIDYIMRNGNQLDIIFMILCGESFSQCMSLHEKKCRHPGSNRGPSDLQSDALPTEL